MQKKFDFFRTWLLGVSLFFALQAVGWIILGSFDLFGIWDNLMYVSLFEGQEIEEVEIFSTSNIH